jgi:uncharacterized membrane protein YcaP (DUF421 family)
MTVMEEILGRGDNLTPLQMSIRAVIIFVVTLVLIRIGGVRMFAKRSAFDTILMITLGAVLSRAIVGASPFLSVVAAATVMVLIHRILGFVTVRNKKIEYWIKGGHTLLYKDGEFVRKNLERTSISEGDLMKSLRLETQDTSLDKVDKAYLEENGRISFVMKKSEPGEPHSEESS